MSTFSGPVAKDMVGIELNDSMRQVTPVASKGAHRGCEGEGCLACRRREDLVAAGREAMADQAARLASGSA